MDSKSKCAVAPMDRMDIGIGCVVETFIVPAGLNRVTYLHTCAFRPSVKIVHATWTLTIMERHKSIVHENHDFIKFQELLHEYKKLMAQNILIAISSTTKNKNVRLINFFILDGY